MALPPRSDHVGEDRENPPASELAPVAEAVRDLDIDVPTAVVVAAEYEKVAPDLRDDATKVVLKEFLTIAAGHGPAGVRQLRQEILARYGEDEEFERHQERCRRLIDLSAGNETSPGVWEYELTTDNEGRGVIEAVIGPLSAPQPDPATGGHDPRPIGRRRGEALIEALRRSVAAAQYVSTSPKAVLLITMSLDQLSARITASTAAASEPGREVNAGTCIGSRAAGTLLAPDTVRKIACDCAVIPTILGGNREILDQGRQKRLFTQAQIKALTLRDQHCTFEGCTAPASWSDAHHLVHWIDGGPTNLHNAALLCPRHHTIVHRDRLAGVVTPQGVVWDRRPNSYRPPGRRPGPWTTPDPEPPPPCPARHAA